MPESFLPMDSTDSKMSSVSSIEGRQAFEKHEADMKENVEALIESLKQKHQMLPHDSDMRKAIKIIIDHFDNHRQYLWGHFIQLQSEHGTFYRIIERTNNLLECFFHEVKHRERRRSGRKNLGNDFESLPASIAIAANLLDADYVRIMFGSLDSLPALFSQMDQNDKINAYISKPSDFDHSNEDNVNRTHSLPNNKAFVRKHIFNDWVKNTSLQPSFNVPENDTISTDQPDTPFDTFESFLASLVPAVQS
jgi:hypothetical protein